MHGGSFMAEKSGAGQAVQSPTGMRRRGGMAGCADLKQGRKTVGESEAGNAVERKPMRGGNDRAEASRCE